MKIVDDGDDNDPPIQPQEYLGGVTVVDFGDLRVKRGMSRRHHSSCPHRKLHYDNQERRIWCADCEKNVDAFDAFVKIVSQYDAAYKKLVRDRAELDEAMSFSALRLATKNLDAVWRKRDQIPACPTCQNGLFPEDFAAGRIPTMGLDYAEAKRAKWKAERGK